MRADLQQLIARKKLALASAGAVLALGAAAVPASAQFVLLNDTFTDNDRLTQTLPGSAQWTVGAHRSTLAYGSLNASAANLVLDHTNTGGERSFAATWAHFTAPNNPVTIPVGESLTLSFTVRFVGGTFANNSGTFRWALFDSGGNRVTTDFAGSNATGISSGTTFSNWRGYEGQSSIDAEAAASNLVTRERTGSTAALFDSNSWTTLTTGAAEASFALNTDYTGTLVLTRTVSGVQVQATLAGKTSNLATDTTTLRTTFDTVTFFTTDAAGHDLVFDNISVVLSPEPTSVAVLALGAGALLARRRRASYRTQPGPTDRATRRAE